MQLMSVTTLICVIVNTQGNQCFWMFLEYSHCRKRSYRYSFGNLKTSVWKHQLRRLDLTGVPIVTEDGYIWIIW